MAQRGTRVSWIGGLLDIEGEGVVASVDQDKVKELADDAIKLLSLSVVFAKALRQYIGVANHIAGVLFPWRAFLCDLWGALAAVGKQAAGAVRIHYSVLACCGGGASVTIVAGASPWCLGGVRVVGGQITQWFAGALSELDAVVLQSSIGSRLGQQAFEALAILVALRKWKSWWCSVRAAHEAKADDVAALTALAKLKGKRAGVATIAREIAFDLCDGAFQPDVCAHAPGIALGIADSLSLQSQPGRPVVSRPLLADAAEG
ncbi:unnamed protein product, partial [Prorocentrum cordatum]